MQDFDRLWEKFANSKEYRDEFVAAQVKRGIPLQIRKLMKQEGMSQQDLALKAGLSQGVVSRAADLEYGNLTINTLIRVASGFDVAFIGKFVPFGELAKWFINLGEEGEIDTFDREIARRSALVSTAAAHSSWGPPQGQSDHRQFGVIPGGRPIKPTAAAQADVVLLSQGELNTCGALQAAEARHA